MSKFSLIVCCAFVVGFAVSSANAVERTIMFSANLDQVVSGEPTLEGDPPMPVFPDLPAPYQDIETGSPFMIEIKYDDEAANEIGVMPGFESELPILEQTIGVYSTPISISLKLDGVEATVGETFAIIVNNDPELIEQLDPDCDTDDFDQITFFAEVFGDDDELLLFALTLFDDTGDAIDDVNLPTGLPALDAFGERTTVLSFMDDLDFDFGDLPGTETDDDGCDPFEHVILNGVMDPDGGDGDDGGDGSDGGSTGGGGEIPAPAALPAGLAMIGMMASRRRRR